MTPLHRGEYFTVMFPGVPGRRWWHVMIGTYPSWLPGDERGFRNRDHRIHSSGDYKNPPPIDEHEGLREYNTQRAGEAVEIPPEHRKRLARIIARLLIDAGYRVAVVSVSAYHVHILAELPVELPEFRSLMGWVKTKASRAVKDVLPGRVWSRGDKHILVGDERHYECEFDYIRNRQGPEAQAWSMGETAGGVVTKQRSQIRSCAVVAEAPCATPRRSAGGRAATSGAQLRIS